jgi:hypothetical protein
MLAERQADQRLVFDNEDGSVIEHGSDPEVVYQGKALLSQSFQRERKVNDEAVRLPVIGQRAAELTADTVIR